jgi:hypothetical protein
MKGIDYHPQIMDHRGDADVEGGTAEWGSQCATLNIIKETYFIAKVFPDKSATNL